MKGGLLQPSNKTNLTTTTTSPSRCILQRVAKFEAEKRIHRLSLPLKRSLIDIEQKLDGSLSVEDTDAKYIPPCTRASNRTNRTCYEGQFAGDEFKFLEPLSISYIEQSNKTPSKSRARSKNEKTPNQRSTRHTLNTLVMQPETENTPSKILANEMAEKLAVNSKKESKRFALTQHNNSRNAMNTLHTELSSKTPSKLRALSKNEKGRNQQSTKHNLSTLRMRQENGNTPSKTLAEEMGEKLIVNSKEGSSRFTITQHDGLKMKLTKRQLSPRKKIDTEMPTVPESKNIVSPSKKARQDPNLDEESNETSECSLKQIRHLLHTCEIPEKLPCREEEYERVCRFIESCARKNGFSQAMYICGVPGTGKTATVMQAIKRFEKLYTFKAAVVNAMELTDPKKIYAKICSALFPKTKKIPLSEARRFLDSFLEGNYGQIPTILVIDELDLLCNGRQEIVYDLFNWTEKATFPVGVIAIANTFDLHERFLARRIISRMGTNRIQFQPYKREEIEAIIKYRLQNCEAVQKDAIELASRKVAAVSGDLRKALDIVRQAIQIAIKEGQNQITIENILKAIRESTSQIYVEVIGGLSVYSRMILRAAVNLLSLEKDHFLFCDLYEVYRKLCFSYELKVLPSTSVYTMVMEMCSLLLLIAAPGVNTWRKKFRLGLTAHDMRTALEIVENVKDLNEESESDA